MRRNRSSWVWAELSVSRPDLPWRFPYVIEKNAEEHPLGRTLMRPAAEARLVGPSGAGQKVFALFDSGCDSTLAAPWMAQEWASILTRVWRPVFKWAAKLEQFGSSRRWSACVLRPVTLAAIRAARGTR